MMVDDEPLESAIRRAEHLKPTVAAVDYLRKKEILYASYGNPRQAFLHRV